MKIKISIVLLLLSTTLFSQEINTDIRNYQSFKNGTTYFIKSGTEQFDNIVANVFEKYWTINDFKMISSSEIEKIKGDSSFFVDIFEYSFNRTGGTTGALHMHYGVQKLIMFKDLKKKKTPKDVIAQVQLNEMNLVDLIFSVKLMQSQIDFVYQLNTKKELDIKSYLKEVREKNMKSIQGKTLYLIQEDLKTPSEEQLKKIYRHKFKFTNQEEIEKAILEQNEEVVIAKIINYMNLRFVLFINAGNGELLYGKVMKGFNQSQIGPTFFKDIDE